MLNLVSLIAEARKKYEVILVTSGAVAAGYTALKSDILIILSDIEGYYEENPKENPKAKIRKIVTHIENTELEQEHSPNNEFATGGIVTKLKAAQYMMKKGKEMFLCSGYDLTTAREFLFQDEYKKGTLFTSKID